MKSNDNSSTMYDLVPAVASLNKVPGFDPLKLMRTVEIPSTGEKAMVLDLQYKKLWFRLAYPKGKIKLNRQKISESLAVFEALIYFDRNDLEPVSSCTVSCTHDDVHNTQAAQNKAIDRALTDAGFGIQFVKPPVSTNYSRNEQDIAGPATPQGITSAEAETKSVQKTAEIVQFKPEESVSDFVENSRGKKSSGYSEDMSVEEIIGHMTYEEACNVVVDTGVCKGMTIAQVAEKRAPSLNFYVYSGYKGSNVLKAAAQIMLNSLQEKKAS